MKLPLGIEKLTRVPVQRQLKQEFGFRTLRAGINSEYATTAETKGESLMLTGDLNVVDAEWIVQYKIKDPYLFLFKMREAEATFRDMTEAVVRRVVGDSAVDEVITVGRTRIADESKSLLQQLCDAYEIGIEVNQLIFQDVNPPETVKPSFNDVNEALQEKEKKINESWAEYNQVIPRASGEAEQVRSRQRISMMEGALERDHEHRDGHHRRAQDLDQAVERNGRQIPFDLGDEPLGQSGPLCQLLLGQIAQLSQVSNSLTDLHGLGEHYKKN
jgi:HflK protein